MARPKTIRTKRTPEVVEQILSAIEDGTPLRKACGDAGVSAPSFMRWVSEDDSLAERYARSKRLQAELLADEIVDIADEEPGTLDNGGTDSGKVAHNRLRVDTRKWILAKLLPKVYGEKVAIGGAEDLPPVQSNVTLDPSEAYKRMLGGGNG